MVPTREDAMSTARAAVRLGVHPQTLQRMVAAGRLPRPMRVGRVYRWTSTDIEAAEAALRGESKDDIK